MDTLKITKLLHEMTDDEKDLFSMDERDILYHIGLARLIDIDLRRSYWYDRKLKRKLTRKEIKEQAVAWLLDKGIKFNG